MKKSNRAVLIIGVVFITILFSIFGTPRYQSMKLKNRSSVDLQNKLNEAIKTNTEVDIKQLTDFDWDECYVFTAYYPPKAIYEEVGVEWTKLKTYILFLLFHDSEIEITGEDQFILVFKKGSKVVMSEFCRLSYLPANFKENYKFSSNNAKFIVTDSEYTKGIQELVLKE